MNEILTEAGMRDIHDLTPQQKMAADIGRILEKQNPMKPYDQKDPLTGKKIKTPDEVIEQDSDVERLANYMEESFRDYDDLLEFIKTLSYPEVATQKLQKAIDTYKKGERADISKDVPDATSNPEDDDDLRDGNEFADKVNKLKAQGAKPGTKFKTSDGKEHVLTDDNIDEDMNAILATAGNKKHGDKYMDAARKKSQELGRKLTPKEREDLRNKHSKNRK